jgi:hypothetical protein
MAEATPANEVPIPAIVAFFKKFRRESINSFSCEEYIEFIYWMK